VLFFKGNKVLFCFVGRQFYNLRRPAGTLRRLFTDKYFTVLSVVFIWEYYLHKDENHYTQIMYVCSAVCRHISSDTFLQFDGIVK